MRYDNLTPGFGAIVYDIDLTASNLYHRDWLALGKDLRQLYDLFCEKKLLILPNQILNNSHLSSVASIFGKVWSNSLEKYNGLTQTSKHGYEDGLVEVVQENGLLGKINLPWHVDLTHFPSQTLPNRLLYATELQGPGASTDFLDTIEGIKLLDQKTFDFLRDTSIHCKAPYKTPWDAVMRRPALNWHPKHKSWSFVADELFTVHIEGCDDHLEFINSVIEQMKSRNTLYSHKWQENDLMIYDNWSTMHSRKSFDNSIRKLKRITWDQDWYRK